MTEAKYLGLTANELAKIASDLDAENAKLREQGARLFDKTLELATENAKLRELIFDMLVDEERGHLLGLRLGSRLDDGCDGRQDSRVHQDIR